MDDYLGSFEDNARVRLAKRRRQLAQAQNDLGEGATTPKSNVDLDGKYPAQQKDSEFKLSNNSIRGIQNLFSTDTGVGAEFYDPANFGTFPEAGVGAESTPLGGIGEGGWAAEGGAEMGIAEGGGEGAAGTLGGTLGTIFGIALAGTAAREYGGDKGVGIFPGSIHEDWVGIGDMADNMFKDPEGLADTGVWAQMGFPLGYGSLTDEDGKGPITDLNKSMFDLFGLDGSDWTFGLF